MTKIKNSKQAQKKRSGCNAKIKRRGCLGYLNFEFGYYLEFGALNLGFNCLIDHCLSQLRQNDYALRTLCRR